MSSDFHIDEYIYALQEWSWIAMQGAAVGSFGQVSKLSGEAARDLTNLGGEDLLEALAIFIPPSSASITVSMLSSQFASLGESLCI